MSKLEPDLHEVVVGALVRIPHEAEPGHGHVVVVGAEAWQRLDGVVLALDLGLARVLVELFADLVHDPAGGGALQDDGQDSFLLKE